MTFLCTAPTLDIPGLDAAPAPAPGLELTLDPAPALVTEKLVDADSPPLNLALIECLPVPRLLM